MCLIIIYGRNNNAANVEFHILHKPNLVEPFISCLLNLKRDIEHCNILNINSLVALFFPFEAFKMA